MAATTAPVLLLLALAASSHTTTAAGWQVIGYHTAKGDAEVSRHTNSH